MVRIRGEKDGGRGSNESMEYGREWTSKYMKETEVQIEEEAQQPESVNNEHSTLR